jgi:putative GTP pyrophosphokinase
MPAPKFRESTANEVSWYSEIRPIYVQLSKKVESLIQEIISDQAIPIHAIHCRAKEVDSFAKKIETRKYTNPRTQVTDLCGIRVITYVEGDLDKVSQLIESTFDIDEENSIDKSESLGEDKVGYRSIHYIAKLPRDRIKLPEYKKFKDIFFEIQIRTILQHAWAEIEHDKNYKFTGELPPDLKRRFKVLAGVLELADREFNGIAFDIDKYSISVNDDTKRGNLDILIDSTSIKSYLKIKFEELIKKKLLEPEFPDSTEKTVLKELKHFGISSLREFDKIIPKDFIKNTLKFKPSSDPNNYAGILRDIMIIHNAEHYFKDCWNNHWDFMDNSSVEYLKLYLPTIQNILKKHKVDTF